MHAIEPAFNLLERSIGRLDLADVNERLLGVVACIKCHLVFGNASKSNWS
jgi:hypothetical protein